ncbi:MAG: PulJ/GspJ family protein [Pirellulaceae bacterium]
MNARPTGHAMRRRPTPRPQPLRAFTLIELLIAMTLTLMLVYAIAQFYAYVGETVRDGRAQIEMGGQLRAAAQRLQQDFAELTVRVGGRIDPGSAQGVLEIWEGVASDSDPTGTLAVNAQGIPTTSIGDVNGDGKPDGAMLGDCDDILVMTIRSQGEPFVGRWLNPATGNYQIVQSNLAEVVWFTTFKDIDNNSIWTPSTEPRFLVRRQLLIRPDLPLALPAGQSNTFWHSDISAHWNVANGSWVSNSLADLSQRENRCVHQNFSNPAQNGLTAAQGYMPNTMQLSVGIPVGQVSNFAVYSLDGIPQFIGEDKVLSNVLAFDVRVYDPYAGLWADNLNLNATDAPQGVLSPGDPGYAFAISNAVTNNVNNRMGNGAYVDLWYNRGFVNLPAGMKSIVLQNCNSAYSWAPNARNFPGGAVWDTWSTAYEKDGVQQVPPPYSARVAVGGIPPEDWMVNGIDDNSTGGVDDPGEAETQPPYPSYIGSNGIDDDGDGNPDDVNEQNTNIYSRPVATILRGIEVRIRMYEPGTRQTRQTTVATDFIPE